MKSKLKIVILLVVFTAGIHLCAQSTDSTMNIKRTDDTTIVVPQQLIFTGAVPDWSQRGLSQEAYSASTVVYTLSPTVVPTCSCLQKRDSLFYQNGDTVAYSGMCVVLYGDNSPDTVSNSKWPEGIQTASIYVTNDGARVKIISHYLNGQRQGSREYFDQKGNLLKTEYYEHGKLTSTVYSN